ncbi:MAG: hypothetical protein L0H63_15160 [Nitrococcus sp.]|nr:hypothetical protein [Nitrococcus sp.]
MGIAAPTAAELQAALGYPRAAFTMSLRRFCERKHLKLPFTQGLHDAQALWSAVMADQVRLFPAPQTAIPGGIDGEQHWLVAAVSDADLAMWMATADLIRIQSAFALGACWRRHSIHSRRRRMDIQFMACLSVRENDDHACLEMG